MPGAIVEAVNCFNSGFLCSQAILCTHCQDCGLDRPTALRLAAGFGGGMGRMGNVCGCVTGAIMVLGLRHGATVLDQDAKQRTYASVQEFTRRFESRHGSIVCRNLLGCDIATAEGYQRAQDQKLFSIICPKLVESAATILEELANSQPLARGT